MQPYNETDRARTKEVIEGVNLKQAKRTVQANTYNLRL